MNHMDLARLFLVGLVAAAMVFPSVTAQMMYGAATTATDCSKFTDADFQAFGDTLMDQMMGKTAHQAMEERLGSETSDAMDLRMGKMMAGCLSSNEWNGYSGYGMMGGMMGYGGMMGNYNYSPFGVWGYWINGLLTLMTFIALALAIIWLWKSAFSSTSQKRNK